jgi:alginate O-acetyltransferase complex protein AlgI
MIFNSLTFLLFLITIFTIFWLLKNKWRNIFLLSVSCIFYGFWHWEYLFLIFISAFLDFYFSLKIYNSSIEKERKFYLILTLFINIGMLIYFKYLYFIMDNSNYLFNILGLKYQFDLVNLILPFGISFYTFETISYTVDVYRRIIKPEKYFLKYALFICFFPKLVAGPIQRAAELIPQFKQNYSIDYPNIVFGIKRILYGFFLKVVLVDNISALVDETYSINYLTASAIDVYTMSFLFGFQIYFDFSAYSHIAIGVARLFNIKIPENFNYPYLSKSLKSFWKSWHISLSAWIRDYLYLPISGIKVKSSSGIQGIGNSFDKESMLRTTIALFGTWGIMGLWHGANWTFLFWGLYHATFIFIERKLRPLREYHFLFRIPLLNWGLTLLIIMLSWIPFRVSNLHDTYILYSRLFNIDNYFYISFRENTYIISFLLLLISIIAYYLNFINEVKFKEKYKYFFYLYTFIKLTILILLITIFLKPTNQFIYFQF